MIRGPALDSGVPPANPKRCEFASNLVPLSIAGKIGAVRTVAADSTAMQHRCPLWLSEPKVN